MKIPDWWEFALLGAAAWRVFQVIAHDDIFDRPRRYVTRLPKSWKEGQPAPSGYRASVGDFLTCSYCCGLYIAIAFWGFFEIWPHAIVVISVPLALSAAVIALSKILSSE